MKILEGGGGHLKAYHLSGNGFGNWPQNREFLFSFQKEMAVTQSVELSFRVVPYSTLGVSNITGF